MRGSGNLAAHGGEHRAVFVCQIESYRYWERELDRSDFVYGQFGENFTVEGLSDDEVCIGDRYQIGAAVFEVTQPRVTCYRVGIRMSLTVAVDVELTHAPRSGDRVLEHGGQDGLPTPGHVLRHADVAGQQGAHRMGPGLDWVGSPRSGAHAQAPTEVGARQAGCRRFRRR